LKTQTLVRLAILSIRPLLILLEGILSDSGLLIFVYPVSALFIALSAIPTYAELYKGIDKAVRKSLLTQYVSSILIIIITSWCVIGIVWHHDISLATCLVLSVSIDKLADELCRHWEFAGKLHKWNLVQFLRNVFPLVPLLLLAIISEINYLNAYIWISLTVAIVFAVIFVRVFGAPLCLYEGMRIIYINLKYSYASGAISVAKYFPKVMMAQSFPSYAYAYQAAAQIANAGVVYTNMRLQVAYRRHIARHPLLFEKCSRGSMRLILFSSAVIGFLLWILSQATSLKELTIELVLMCLAIAEAMAAFVFGAYVGYLRWLGMSVDVLRSVYFVVFISLIWCSLLWFGVQIWGIDATTISFSSVVLSTLGTIIVVVKIKSLALSKYHQH